MENEKGEIINKILSLFFKYGIKSVSMDDISRELGMSKKTLYQIFKDKKDLVEQVLSFHQGCGLKEVRVRAKDAVNAMEEYLKFILMIREWIEELNPSFEYDLEKYYPDLYKKNKEAKIANMTDFFTENVNRGKNEGVYRDDFDAEVITKFHIITIMNIQHSGMFTMTEMMNFDIYRQYFLFLMRGIASGKGLEILEKKFIEYGLN